MPFTYHQDILGHSTAGYFFAYHGVPNIYDHLLSLPADHPLVKNIGVTDIFIYPPLTYYTLGLFRLIIKPFADPNFVPWAWSNLSSLYSYPTLFWQLFLFKFPYLFFDIGCAFFLAGLFDDFKKKKWAFILWMFNPITLYATFMIGQLDILPVFFTILSCYLIKRKQFGWALFSLGIGAGYKVYPLLLVLPAAFILGTTFWKKVKLAFIGVLPFLAISLPFINSTGYRQMVLFGPKSGKELFMIWNVSGAEGIFPFILILTIIYLMAFYLKKKLSAEYYFLSILLLTLSVTHYHPQWFLWVTPFLVWELVENNFRYLALVAIILISWFIIMLFFEPSLSIGLFAPVWPNLTKAPGLTEIVSRYTDVANFKSIVRSVFAGASLFYIWSKASE